MTPRESDREERIEEFGETLVAARNVGVQTLKRILDEGWRPKAPTQQALNVISLVESSAGTRAELLDLVRYCTDLSFHKLLTSLEEGELVCPSRSRCGRSARTRPFLSWTKSKIEIFAGRCLRGLIGGASRSAR